MIRPSTQQHFPKEKGFPSLVLQYAIDNTIEMIESAF